MSNTHVLKGSIISVLGATATLVAFAFMPLAASAITTGALAAAPSPCDNTSATPFLTGTAHITNDPDSGNFGNWATDAFTENISVWVGTDGTTYCATAKTTDGTFVTTGPNSPNTGVPLAAGITGTFTGGETYTFPSAALNPAYSTTTPSTFTIPDSSTAGFSWWVNQVFPAIASSTGSHYTNTYWLSYTTPNNGSWIDSDPASGGNNTGDIASVYDITSGIGYATIQNAIDSATDGDTIVLGADITLASQLNVTKAITLDGNGHTLSASFAKASNSNNSAIGITHNNVTIKDLLVDGTGGQAYPNQLHGVNVYEVTGVILDAVTVSSFKGAAMIVNGSDVTATNLNTSGNSWGSVDVDPGSGVTLPSAFTLNSGTLGDGTQIWSDGKYVTASASVTVNASGYTMYKIGGTTAGYVWANKPITNAAVITEGATSTLYSTIQAALNAASTTVVDTITVGPGNYAENPTINKSVNLVGPNAAVNPNTGTRGAEATVTGSIVDYAGDTSIKGFTITNPSYGGSTIEGIHIYKAGTVMSNIDVENNIFSHIANAQAHGSYAVMVQGVVSNVNVSNNKIDGITSTGWAHAIEVTPTCNTVAAPQGVTVDGNSISNVTSTAATPDEYGFSVDECNSSNVADASQITFHSNVLNAVNVRNLDTANNFDATKNFWGVGANPTTFVVGSPGVVSVSPWWSDADMTILKFTLTTSGGQASTTVPSDIALTGTSGSVTVTADIPAGTVITGSSSWDGTLNPPTATTTTVTIPSFDTSVTSAIAIGSNESDLTFNKGVRLLFSGQAGKEVGWYNHAGTFTPIIDTCGADNQTVGDALAAGGSCKMDAGSDLVVWTKHFSVFVTYTQTHVAPPPSSGGGGGGGGGGGNGAPEGLIHAITNILPTTNASPKAIAATTNAAANQNARHGQVLGAAAYNFTHNLALGSHGTDVDELQKLLIADGDLSVAAPTDYFGALTRAAVIKFQEANGISPQSGFVGPLTRAELNKGTTPTASDEQRTLLIQSLQAELNALLKEIQQLTSATSTATSTTV